MSVYRPKYRDPKTGELKQSEVWWYGFRYAGARVRESAMTTKKTLATDAERQRRAELEEKAISKTQRQKATDRTQAVGTALKNYEETYEGKNRAWVKSICKVTSERLAGRLLVDLNEDEIKRYRNRRKDEGSAERSINIECDTLARAFGSKFSTLWPGLNRLREPKSSGRALSETEVKALLTAADANKRARYISTLIRVALLTGLRSSELRHLQWGRIDLSHGILTVGESKTEAGEGREVPINEDLRAILEEHRGWFISKFGDPAPEMYLFPFCENSKPADPMRPVDDFKKGWQTSRTNAKVKARFHDLRHTYISRLAESGAPESVIRKIVGHIDENVLRRYTHTSRSAIQAAVSGLSLPGVAKVLAKVTTFPGSKGDLKKVVNG